MKKAKRLLAVLLAAVMLASAACLPTYAYKAESVLGDGSISPNDNYHIPYQGSDGKYYFSYEQGAAYVLDLLDNLLKDANIVISGDELNDLAGLNVTGLLAVNKLCGPNGAGENGDYIDLRSIDNLVWTITGLIMDLDEAFLVGVANVFNAFGDLLKGDAKIHSDGLSRSINRTDSTDREVLEMLILWLNNMRPALRKIVAGTYNWGALDSAIPDMIKDLAGFLKLTLYQLLVNDSATEIPAGETLDGAVQQLLNWALIEGTGETAETGALSLLGPNHTALMPAVGDQPGGIDITATPIQADRDGDGAIEDCTMNTYQLVHNIIRGVLDGMLAPMLSDVLIDALDIEITEQYPMGDPAMLSDVMFNTIIGAVEGLAVQNGAPAPTYTEEENSTPVGKINALLDWFFNGGGLDTFIKIDYLGIHIQDNLMSLLGDIARLAINLLPGMGVFESSASLAYSADDLNRVWYYDANLNLVAQEDETKVDKTYVTYETGEVIYPTAKKVINEVETITAYSYLSTDMPVNITDERGSNYVDPDLIRPNYEITKSQVFACLVKMMLNDMIDGCYFPEWTQDIPSVLAYGFAGLAATKIPENNYYARLDAYHDVTVNGEAANLVDASGKTIEPLPYTIDKYGVTIPKAALDIIASFGASRLNGVFQLNGVYFDTDTTLEKFACEFLGWGFTRYMPMLTGTLDPSTGTLVGDGTWKDAMNTFNNAIYSDYTNHVFKETANFDAIYDLIDETLFKLIPVSWMPNMTGSFQFINEWLLGNLIEFDLQGILDLLSVNTASDAELNQPLLTVLLRVIDRVLAIVFNDHGLLLPNGRTNVVKSNNITNITSLDALLAGGDVSASLPVLVDNLLMYLETYKVMLLSTALPLIVAQIYEKPYQQEYLGSKGVAYYKVDDLDRYIKSFTENINATKGVTFTNRDDARAAVDGNATAVKNADGITYDIKLSNGAIYGNYPDMAAATDIINALKNAYVFEKTADDGTTTYTVYLRKSYLDCAKADPATETIDGYKDSYTVYSNFSKAELTPRSTSYPFVSYDSAYRFYEYEDFAAANYVYGNAKDAVSDAERFVSTYNSFPKNDLPAAYGTWMNYSIKSRLRAAGLYDSNDDGLIVNSSTDAGYDATNPNIDGDPGIPSAMYPFSTTAATAFTYYDSKTGENITVTMNTVTPEAYEQLSMAIAYGNDPANDVELSTIEKEALVRLALGTINFDITPSITVNEDGTETETYHTGSFKWDGLSADQLATIDTFCASNGYKFVYDTAAGTYTITRSAFKVFDSNFTLGTVDVSTTPLADVSSYTAVKETDRTYAQKTVIQLNESYADYVENLYANRRSLYNKIDYISYRYEMAETSRTNSGFDTTMLKWVLNLTASAYKDTKTKRRNCVFTGAVDSTTNEAITTKAYTATTYSKFREAYDFGTSLVAAVESQSLAAGITQAMISEAYYGILETYKGLLPFTGPADMTQLLAYIKVAEEIIADPNKDDPVLGYESSGLDVLRSTLTDAETVRDDDTIDCESQQTVDNMAALLNQAIQNLVYNTVPSIIPSTDDPDSTVSTKETSNVNNRIVGQVFGLSEGVGAIMSAIDIVGMREDAAIGSTVSITPSSRGNGTGAYYRGTVKGQERFRYFAVVYGDLNGDARVDGTDATALEYYMLTNDVLTAAVMGSAKFEAADANHDGVVDQSDVATIVKHYTFKESIDQTVHSTN